MSPYDSISHSFGEALLKVSTRLKEVFNCEMHNFQQGVRGAVRTAARSTESLFAGAPGAVNKGFVVIVGRASKTGRRPGR